MKNKIIMSYLFFGCCTLNVYADSSPQLLKTPTNKPHIQTIKTLNIDLPALPKPSRNDQDHIKTNSPPIIILASAKRFKIKNLLVLSTTKNAVLKATLKRRSYGLRYTRIW